jgi:MFS family permease
LATLNVAIPNPAVVPLSEEFHVAEVTGTYQTTIAIGTSAIGPLVFVPIANVYGRRFIYLFTLLIGFVSAIGSASAKSFGTLIVARAFNGSGAATAAVLGAGTISDMCYMHQRGKAMGLYTVMLTNGAHLAPIVSPAYSSKLIFPGTCQDWWLRRPKSWMEMVLLDRGNAQWYVMKENLLFDLTHQ